MHPTATRTLAGGATAVVIFGAAAGVASGDPGLVGVSLAAAFAVAAGWIIVRREPASPVGPALAWTTGAIVFVTAPDTVVSVPWTAWRRTSRRRWGRVSIP
jgi:hypothetical protein